MLKKKKKKEKWCKRQLLFTEYPCSTHYFWSLPLKQGHMIHSSKWAVSGSNGVILFTVGMLPSCSLSPVGSIWNFHVKRKKFPKSSHLGYLNLCTKNSLAGEQPVHTDIVHQQEIKGNFKVPLLLQTGLPSQG